MNYIFMKGEARHIMIMYVTCITNHDNIITILELTDLKRRIYTPQWLYGLIWLWLCTSISHHLCCMTQYEAVPATHLVAVIKTNPKYICMCQEYMGPVIAPQFGYQSTSTMWTTSINRQRIFVDVCLQFTAGAISDQILKAENNTANWKHQSLEFYQPIRYRQFKSVW